MAARIPSFPAWLAAGARRVRVPLLRVLLLRLAAVRRRLLAADRRAGRCGGGARPGRPTPRGGACRPRRGRGPRAPAGGRGRAGRAGRGDPPPPPPPPTGPPRPA